jgi:cellulose synthase/poly-beta-1,6-N-acetylglucosamine synthase-like glycosyltransferase
MEFIYASYILSFVFLLLAVIIYFGYKFEFQKTGRTSTNPKLSIVIAAKNEELNINTLLDSLENLDYPNENFEVIIVDDNSTDRTSELIQSRIAGKNNFTFIRAKQKEMEGKKGALTEGIKKAKYDYIVITDADCKPEINWLKAMVSKLNEGYDFVFGVSPILLGKSLVEKISAFENLRNTFLTIAAVGLKIPYSASARSFAFRNKSFKNVGGYTNTTETLSGDDDLLLREAVKNKMLIGTVIEPEAFVFSSAPKSFAEYFRQKKRHLQTSFHYLPKQKLFLGFWHLINLLSMLIVLLIFLSPVLLLPFIIKLFYDVFVVLKHQRKLGHSFRFYEVIYLQIIFEILVIVNFFNSLFGKIEWK